MMPGIDGRMVPAPVRCAMRSLQYVTMAATSAGSSVFPSAPPEPPEKEAAERLDTTTTVVAAEEVVVVEEAARRDEQARSDSHVQTVCMLILAFVAAGFSLNYLKPVLVPFVLAL